MYYLILKHTIIKSWHLGDDDQPLNTCKYVNAHCISPPRPLEKEHVYNLELRYLEICYHNILTSAGPTLKHLPEIASLCPGLDTSPTCWWRHHLHHHCHRHHHHSHHNQDHQPHLKKTDNVILKTCLNTKWTLLLSQTKTPPPPTGCSCTSFLYLVYK